MNPGRLSVNKKTDKRLTACLFFFQVMPREDAGDPKDNKLQPSKINPKVGEDNEWKEVQKKDTNKRPSVSVCPNIF